jgi:glycosyltransferase involved in cell wall biosynthesis
VRVLFLNPIGTLGGAEKELLDLVASLRSASPELRLELLALEDGPLLSEASALGVSVDVLPLPNFLATLGESRAKSDEKKSWLRGFRSAGALGLWLPQFAGVLRRKRADVLHSNGLKTHLLAAVAKPRGIPLIWHLHDFISERRFTARLLPLLQDRAALGIAVSQAVAEDARRTLRRLKIETVLNGIRTEHFVPGKAAPVDLDALAGMRPAPRDTVRVGLVATYASWKGHHIFLEAAHRVTAPNARFYIVGGPVYTTQGSQVTEQELRETISRLGLIDRCGLVPFQTDIARVYAALDIVAQASTKPEPFGRTVAEAMSSGCATVAFGAGGVLEQVDAKNGILVPPLDTELFAQRIEELITSPSRRHQLGTEASRSARERLDSRRLGQAVAPIYSSLKDVHRAA